MNSDPSTIRILAILGSLRRRSANRALLRAAVSDAPASLQIAVYDSLAELPHFNPDLEPERGKPPPPVSDFRAHLQASEAVLIVSPEYAHSLPGAVKNALDWVVGSGELANKPVGLISTSTVSTGGARAQIALTTTLLAQAANVVAWLTVPAVLSKLDDSGELSHAATRRRVRETLLTLADAVTEGGANEHR